MNSLYLFNEYSDDIIKLQRFLSAKHVDDTLFARVHWRAPKFLRHPALVSENDVKIFLILENGPGDKPSHPNVNARRNLMAEAISEVLSSSGHFFIRNPIQKGQKVLSFRPVANQFPRNIAIYSMILDKVILHWSM